VDATFSKACGHGGGVGMGCMSWGGGEHVEDLGKDVSLVSRVC
jgi:hypothetical protein